MLVRLGFEPATSRSTDWHLKRHWPDVKCPTKKPGNKTSVPFNRLTPRDGGRAINYFYLFLKQSQKLQLTKHPCHSVPPADRSCSNNAQHELLFPASGVENEARGLSASLLQMGRFTTGNTILLAKTLFVIL